MGKPALAGWNITLSGPINSWTLTDEDGYYEFTGLTARTYTVSEILQTGWKQTYLVAPRAHTIIVTSGTDSKNNNFGNKVIRFLEIFADSGSLNGYTSRQ